MRHGMRRLHHSLKRAMNNKRAKSLKRRPRTPALRHCKTYRSPVKEWQVNWFVLGTITLKGPVTVLCNYCRTDRTKRLHISIKSFYCRVCAIQWRIQGGGSYGSWPSPWGPGAPQACQGHHRPIRGTTGLSEAPQARQGHHRPSRGTTGLSGPRGTTGLK